MKLEYFPENINIININSKMNMNLMIHTQTATANQKYLTHIFLNEFQTKLG